MSEPPAGAHWGTLVRDRAWDRLLPSADSGSCGLRPVDYCYAPVSLVSASLLGDWQLAVVLAGSVATWQLLPCCLECSKGHGYRQQEILVYLFEKRGTFKKNHKQQ